MSRPPGEQGGAPSSAVGSGGLLAGDVDSAALRGRSRMPLRIVVGALAALLLVGSAVHLGPAIKAGLHDGTRGSWVATSRTCNKASCIWQGKFVLPDGQVKVASAQYSGQLPQTLHAGTTIPALDTGEAGLVFPATGSDLWISLLVGMLISALALYWAARKPLSEYLSKRRETAAAAAAARHVA
jgi:hypothetical protein